MKRYLVFVFSLLAYILFLGSFLYLIGFLGDFYVPKTINTGTIGNLWLSLLVNLGLIAIFGLQHTIMARSSFKDWLTSVIPVSAERSVYVLFSSICLFLLFGLWQPLPQTIWNLEGHWLGTIIVILFWLGWLIVLLATFMIDHFNLFGLRQSYHALIHEKPDPIEFQKPGFYKVIRHPIMSGFLLAFWATPYMTLGHLIFAIGMTFYILIGVMYEERDLIIAFDDRYRTYRNNVPKFFPFIK